MRAWIMAVGLVLAGCSGSGGEECSEAGATRCMANGAESCTDGEWQLDDDCEADGGTCMQDESMMGGDAHCM